MSVGTHGIVEFLEGLMANPPETGYICAAMVAYVQREQFVRSPGSMLVQMLAWGNGDIVGK